MSNGIYIVEQHAGSVLDSLMPELEGSRRMSWQHLDLQAIQRTKTLRMLIVHTADAEKKALHFFEWLRTHAVGAPVCAILPVDSASSLLQSAAAVADQLVLSSAHDDAFRRCLRQLLGMADSDSSAIASRLTAEAAMGQMIGDDPAFRHALRLMTRYAPAEVPVLLTGETGTGKELGARLMHLLGSRQDGPFIPVDCGALPDHLFENEVFGREAGISNDVQTAHMGLVALAEQGTLFLDEIDSLSIAAQGKVLLLLQEQSYQPLGSPTFHRADVRILAATNRNLEELVERGLFRADLFRCIHALCVHLPALRERRGDIALLSRHFVEQICADSSVPRKGLSRSAIQHLERHAWPGNIRELYNVLQRAVLCSEGTQLTATDLIAEGYNDDAAPSSTVEPEGFRRAKIDAVQNVESDRMPLMAHKHAGNARRGKLREQVAPFSQL